MKQFKTIRDRFRKSRGGNSQFFNIFCGQCGSWIMMYQKDGVGSLIRLYLDRILAPTTLASLQYSTTKKDELTTLVCPKCQNRIGDPMIYEPEKRLAFRLLKGACRKQKSDGSPPQN